MTVIASTFIGSTDGHTYRIDFTATTVTFLDGCTLAECGSLHADAVIAEFNTADALEAQTLALNIGQNRYADPEAMQQVAALASTI